MNKYELLAPAGSFEKMEYAFEYGADAVYAGMPEFSLRARINKFDEKQLLRSVGYAHERGKKLYITMNVFAHNAHLFKMEKFLKIFKMARPDAIVASDPGVIDIINKILPGMSIHLSTQANTTNWMTVKFWKKYGVKRIVLARELDLDEITFIHKKAPDIQLEYFVHGSMCMAYSGRCLLSSWFTGRSSNLGDCSQNCRWKYGLMKENSLGKSIYVEEDDNGSYLLNSKDLCLIDYLDELKKAGITSFKIEGRAKSVHYLAQVVKSYRIALDLKTRGRKKTSKLREIKKDLKKIQNRGFTTGFLFGECKFEGIEKKYSHLNSQNVFCGEVLERNDKKGLAMIRVHNAIFKGEKIEILNPNSNNMKCDILGIIDKDTFESMDAAHGGQDRRVYVKMNAKPRKYAILRKIINV